MTEIIRTTALLIVRNHVIIGLALSGFRGPPLPVSTGGGRPLRSLENQATQFLRYIQDVDEHNRGGRERLPRVNATVQPRIPEERTILIGAGNRLQLNHDGQEQRMVAFRQTAPSNP
ncbi:MAG: hypothetical protein ACKO4A_10285 [Gammaproteobacteria bacterium]